MPNNLYPEHNEREAKIACPHCNKSFEASDSATWLAIVGEFNSALQELNLQKVKNEELEREVSRLKDRVSVLDSLLESDIEKHPSKHRRGWPPPETDENGNILE